VRCLGEKGEREKKFLLVLHPEMSRSGTAVGHKDRLAGKLALGERKKKKTDGEGKKGTERADGIKKGFFCDFADTRGTHFPLCGTKKNSIDRGKEEGPFAEKGEREGKGKHRMYSLSRELDLKDRGGERRGVDEPRRIKGTA